jgi:magnesium chelatase family protein
MNISKVLSTTLIGLQAQIIEIEVDLSSGLPQIIMVGLPDKSIQESKERIRTAFKSTGLDFPLAKITVNFAPASIIKAGSHYDLAISLGILKCLGVVKLEDENKETIFLGEISLDGSLKPIKGVLPMILALKKNKVKKVFIPLANSEEASLVSGIEIYGVRDLKSLILHLNQTEQIPMLEGKKYNQSLENNLKDITDFKDIKGQVLAKRGFLIAASGGHNIMLVGDPGSGKTLMARALVGILPPLEEEELLDVAQIYSISNEIPQDIFNLKRPFRAPHHTASDIALIGGGSRLMPGEVSLAHRGILFLDEFAEFRTQVIESLRQPVEDGFVQISRASGTVVFPSKFILVCASNPSPNGYLNNSEEMNSQLTRKYKSKLSGPISDRIDLHIQLTRPKNIELLNNEDQESTKEILERVIKARQIQKERFKNSAISLNSEMDIASVKKYCQLDNESEEILAKAIEKYKLTGRSFYKILKLSRTIADLDNAKQITSKHLIESLMFRPKNL